MDLNAIKELAISYLPRLAGANPDWFLRNVIAHRAL